MFDFLIHTKSRSVVSIHKKERTKFCNIQVILLGFALFRHTLIHHEISRPRIFSDRGLLLGMQRAEIESLFQSL